jgi:hypothetical protein
MHCFHFLPVMGSGKSRRVGNARLMVAAEGRQLLDTPDKKFEIHYPAAILISSSRFELTHTYWAIYVFGKLL